MKLAPRSVALALIALGAAIAVAGLLKRVPSHDSLQVTSGRVDGVQTRRMSMSDDVNNVLVELSVVGQNNARHVLAFRQPESRLSLLHGLGGRNIVARTGSDGELFDLRIGQVSLQSYMQTVEPLMMDKAWTLLCGGMFAGIGSVGIWLTRRRSGRKASAGDRGLVAGVAEHTLA